MRAGLDAYARDPLQASPEVSLTGEPLPRYDTEESLGLLRAAIQLGIYRLPAEDKR